MISITFDRIVKRFGDFTALKDVSFTIEPGEMFFLLGPSGCGKTTLLRLLAGFHKPDAGRVLFNGEDMSQVPPHKRGTAMMFQSYALWPHMTVEENVAFGLKERKVETLEREIRVKRALRMVRMETLGYRKINELSGGQQQRVALARSIVVRPRCLMLDEPLSNLDAKLRLEMRTEIRRICKEHKLTAVYVTHDQKEALSMADRMAVMDAGRVVQIGPPREIYRKPNSALVAGFIGETNFLQATVTKTTGDGHVETNCGGRFFAGVSTDGHTLNTRDKVLLSIRPESFRFSAASNGPNALPVKIVGTSYLGEIAQYDLLGPDDVKIRLFEMNPRHLRQPGEQPHHITVEAQDVCALKETPADS